MFPLWLTGIAALGLFAGLAWYLAPLEPGAMALQLAFTARSFGEIVHFWSPEQLLRFRAHLPIDCLLLLSYGAFGYLLASRTQIFHSLPPALRQWAKWALPVAAAFDAAENALHLWLTEVPRFGVRPLYPLAASCATLKWVLVLAFVVTLVIALARTRNEPTTSS